ncbi:hypothetical protein PH7735_03238 [Shimia thalassica]|uniref:DUF3987 domain-containing protein n=1 Tax=Shimia thalassica TaxID=1715693 RepID=A0A0P1IUZ4_9RHOB|nr:YfjI family protein [Shimia thalassica]CUK08383.1 hypothetical protein PH7735_03238 [Shimia thalassica]
MNAPEPIHFKAEGPQPLVREIPAGETYPIDALGPLKAATEAAQDTAQAPIALAAQSALSIASLAVQGFADVETLGGYAPLSLYCLTVANSGERKSATDKVLMQGLRNHEQEQDAEYRKAIQRWQNDAAIWEADHRQAMKPFTTGKGDRIAAQADLEELGASPAQPIAPNLTATEPTLEGLQKLFAVGQPSLGLFSDEGGQFLGGHSMNSDNRLKTVAGLSDLWGGAAINRTRSGDGTSTLYGRRLAAHLMVQPIAAVPFLSDPVASGQGLSARFLITQPPSAIGSRLYKTPSAESIETLQGFADRLKVILATSKPTADDDPQHLKPRQLPLSGSAWKLLVSYYNTIEVQQAPGGDLEHVTSFASKSAEQAARIAGVLTLWGNLDALEVSATDMGYGVALAQYYLGEAQRLANVAAISQETEQAERLRKWLLDSWPDIAAKNGRSSDFVLPGDVAQYAPMRGLRETKVAKKALGLLMQHGCIQPLEQGAEVDGVKRKAAYRIVRGQG